MHSCQQQLHNRNVSCCPASEGVGVCIWFLCFFVLLWCNLPLCTEIVLNDPIGKSCKCTVCVYSVWCVDVVWSYGVCVCAWCVCVCVHGMCACVWRVCTCESRQGVKAAHVPGYDPPHTHTYTHKRKCTWFLIASCKSGIWSLHGE